MHRTIALLFVLAVGAPRASVAAASAPEVAIVEQAGATSPNAPAELLDPGVLRHLSLTFHDADWEAALARLATTDEYVHADLAADGQELADIGVRIKGNSSARAPGRKEPLNLGLDSFVAGQDLAGYDTLNLNNMFADPTMVREVLTYSILRPYVPVPRATFSRVDANGAYFGLYTLVEQIEKTYLRTWFPTPDGYLFKADPPGGMGGGSGASDLSWQGETLASYKASYELKTDVVDDSAWIALRELTRVLDAPVAEGGTTDLSLPAEVEPVLDVDGVLWYLAASNLLANFDSYYSRHNYYLYRTPEDGRFHILSWDMNESFGVFRPPDQTPVTSDGIARIDPFVATGAGRGQPLLRRLLAVPAYRQDYLAHYRTLLAEVLDVDALTTQVNVLHDLIRNAAQTDPNPLYGFDLFERSLSEDVTLAGGGPGGGMGGRPVPGLLALASKRAEWLRLRQDMVPVALELANRLLQPDPVVADEPAQVMVDLRGTATPAHTTLVYAVDGGAPATLEMTPGGIGYSAVIPGQTAGVTVRYYVRAELADGRTQFFPAANSTQPWAYEVVGKTLPPGQAGSLVLNEVQADNAVTIADPAGQFDDWLELYNRGDQPVDLAGYYLSDDAADPHQFALPAGTLAPGAFLLIWCDSDPMQGSDHAPFKISKEGDSLFLSNESETVDQIDLGPQVTDHSFARSGDGADNWVECLSPSPRAPNVCDGVPPVDTPTPRTPTPTQRPPTSTHTPSGPTPVPVATLFLPRAEAGR